MAEADKQIVPADAAGEDAAPKKKGKLKLIIMGVLVLAILGGGGFFGWKFFFGPKDGESAAVAQSEAELAEGGNGEAPVDKDGKPLLPPMAPAPQLIVTLDPFMTNLADAGGRRFLRVIVALDVETEEMRDAINARMPGIRNALLELFSSKNSPDLLSAQGKYRLRMEILRVINNQLGIADKITKAFYMEFVVQ